MKVIKNTIYAIKLVIQNIPLLSSLFIIITLVASLFIPLQIIYTEKIISTILNHDNDVLINILILLLCITGGSFINAIKSMLKPIIEHKFYIKFMPHIYEKNKKIEYIEFEKSDNQDLFDNLTFNPSQKIIYIFYDIINLLFMLTSLFGIIFSFLSISIVIGLLSMIVGIPMYITECKGVNDEISYRWNMTKDIRKRSYIQSLFVDKSALQEIKVYDEKNFLFKKSDHLTSKINNDLLKVIKKSIKFTSLSSFIMICFLFLVILTSTFYCIKAVMSVAQYVAILTALSKFISYSRGTAYSFASFSRQIKFIDLYIKYLNLPERKMKYLNCDELNKNIVIELKNVCFKYPNSTENILENINLKFSNHEKIGLVGANGCGKTTLVKILCGLYKPTSGQIYINNIPIDNLSIKELCNIYSIVFQDFKKFYLSMRENISLSNLEKLNEDNEIISIMNKTKLNYLVSNNNIDFHLGNIYDDGIDVSYGEWQKISICRMLYNPKKMLILDEPSSALDAIVENQLYEFISNNFKELGMVLVTHRLSSIKLVNRILVIDNKTIVEDGTHEELMKQKRLYYKMYSTQSGWYNGKKE